VAKIRFSAMSNWRTIHGKSFGSDTSFTSANVDSARMSSNTLAVRVIEANPRTRFRSASNCSSRASSSKTSRVAVDAQSRRFAITSTPASASAACTSGPTPHRPASSAAAKACPTSTYRWACPIIDFTNTACGGRLSSAQRTSRHSESAPHQLGLAMVGVPSAVISVSVKSSMARSVAAIADRVDVVTIRSSPRTRPPPVRAT
jgi:hypothetical protein